ncbi:hypothetical protein, partial [Siminovitchia fortis]|uniref:hypothetical protein n=1 Tax=Siminovitchia fortis TaxID=254758 RepID=UPI001C92C4A7
WGFREVGGGEVGIFLLELERSEDGWVGEWGGEGNWGIGGKRWDLEDIFRWWYGKKDSEKVT